MSFKAIVAVVFVFVAGLGAGYLVFGAQSVPPVVAEDTAAPVAESLTVPAPATMDEAEVRRIVEAYIKENPVVIMQSVSEYQQFGQLREMAARAEPYLEMLQATENAGIVGDAAAEVKIIEYFDYQCPHCKANYTVLARLLAEDKTVALMPKYLPILGDGSENDMSLYGARAAEAARLQGKFAAFHEAMIQSELPISREGVDVIAARVGLDVARLHRDMASPAVERAISDSRALADEIGISQAGTPGYIIGKQVMIGAAPDSYERLKAMIEAARAGE